MSLIKKIAFAASRPFNLAADVIWVRPLHRIAGAPKRHELGALIKSTDKNPKKITQAETYIKKCVVSFACEKKSIVSCEIIYLRSMCNKQTIIRPQGDNLTAPKTF